MRADLIFSRVARFSYRHWKANLFLALAIISISPLILRGLRFEAVTPTVRSSSQALSRTYVKNLRRFGDSSPLVIHLRFSGVALRAVNLLTDRLTEELEGWEEILYVEAKVLDYRRTSLAATLSRAALMNSGIEVKKRFGEKMTPEGMRRELLKTRRRIIALDDPFLRELISVDVLNLREILLPFFEVRLGSLKLSLLDEYFDDESGTSRLIFVQPRGYSEDADFCTALLRKADLKIQEVKRAIPGTEAISYRFVGKYALTAEATEFLRGEMTRITLAATALIFFLVWIAFRRARAIFICFTPLLISLVIVLQFAALFFSPLDFMALSFAAIILGLGIDVMIHLTGRFFQLVGQASTVEEAVVRTLADSGAPLVISITSTAAAFLCLVLSTYKPLIQFAILTSTGLLISLAVCLLFFPTMVRIFGPRDPGAFKPPAFRWFPRKLYLAAFSRPYAAIFVWMLLVGTGLYLARNFSFEMDLLKLLPKKLEAFENAREVSRLFGTSFIADIQLTLESARLDEAMAAQRLVDERLAELIQEKKISSFQSPSVFIPYGRMDEEELRLLERAFEAAKENETIFFNLLAEYQFKTRPEHRDYYKMIKEASSDLSEAERHPQLDRFLAREEGKIYLQTYVWATNDLDDLESVYGLAREFEDFALPPGVTLKTTGTFQVFVQILRNIRLDFLRVGMVSLAVIILLLSFYFRRLSMVAMTLLPVASAVVATFGFIVLARIPFTPAEIGVTALILGMGIDDSVHILTRVGRKEGKKLPEVMVEIGPVITLTTLTTMAGFSCLMLATNAVTFTLGAVVAFGMLACLFFAVLLIPALGSRKTFPKGPPFI